MDSETTVAPIEFEPFNWLSHAKIYNKNGNIIPPSWLEDNANVIVLLFTSNGVDREGIIQKFYTIYENIKFQNIPLEVIYVPLDESEKEYIQCYDKQANWFALRWGDPQITILKFCYGITCIPQMMVIKPDCSMVSSNALLDIEEYGKNAVVTWLTPGFNPKNKRRMSKETSMYGTDWKYVSTSGEKKVTQKRFSVY